LLSQLSVIERRQARADAVPALWVPENPCTCHATC
jgi:hypothetical protein